MPCSLSSEVIKIPVAQIEMEVILAFFIIDRCISVWISFLSGVLDFD